METFPLEIGAFAQAGQLILAIDLEVIHAGLDRPRPVMRRLQDQVTLRGVAFDELDWIAQPHRQADDHAVALRPRGRELAAGLGRPTRSRKRNASRFDRGT